MVRPKVSIVIATYNRAHLIEETIRSIQAQSYVLWECLVIDDGGTDNTKEIVESLMDNDVRVKFFTRSDPFKKGLPGSRNYGIEKANGDYIIFFDDDDIIHPLNLETCISVLTTNTDKYFCNYQKYSFEGVFDYNSIDKTKTFNEVVTDNHFLEKMIRGVIPVASCTVMWKKECFKNNLFNENLMYAEEWELYSRVISKGIQGVLIDKVLYFNRKHSNSNTGEFWNNNPIRLSSYKYAVKLVFDNLVSKEMLTRPLLKYLLSIAIDFRDRKLFYYIISKSNENYKGILIYKIKYSVFPLWALYSRFVKKRGKKNNY